MAAAHLRGKGEQSDKNEVNRARIVCLVSITGYHTDSYFSWLTLSQPKLIKILDSFTDHKTKPSDDICGTLYEEVISSELSGNTDYLLFPGECPWLKCGGKVLDEGTWAILLHFLSDVFQNTQPLASTSNNTTKLLNEPDLNLGQQQLTAELPKKDGIYKLNRKLPVLLHVLSMGDGGHLQVFCFNAAILLYKIQQKTSTLVIVLCSATQSLVDPFTGSCLIRTHTTHVA